MIVESLIVVTGFVAVTKPPIALLLAARLAELEGDKPKTSSISIQGKTRQIPMDDFTDSRGRKVVDFMVAKLAGCDQPIVLSRSEVELFQQQAFLRACLKEEHRLGENGMRRLIEVIESRKGEITQVRGRRVK